MTDEKRSPPETTAITPPYPFAGRDKPIELYRGVAELRQGGEVVLDGDAIVSLTWLPHPNVRFDLVGKPSDVWDLGAGELTFTALPGAPSVPVFVGRATLERSEASGTFQQPLRFGAKTVTRVDFLLANWPAMRGQGITSPEHGWWLGRVVIDDGPWRIRLEVRPDNRAIVDELKDASGFAPTHVGRIERIDGNAFSITQARDLMDGLDLFFGLARGFWTPPLLPVGYDGDTVVWREWLGRTSGEWESNFAWFSSWHPHALADAFPLFMQRWRDPAWHDSLVLGVSWFIEANGHGSAETSILLGQVALELFGWVILVEERGLVSRKVYRHDNNAETNVTALLSWAQIPPNIPIECTALQTWAKGEGWANGPAALIGFRNKLTHPRDRADQIFAAPPEARVELRQLVLWYVELILLRFCGYRGDYIDRHKPGKVGDVEAVPWK
jgi:hypothetical protein